MHPAHATLCEHHRAFHSSRPGADDEYVVFVVRRLIEPLRMPAAPVLFARGRVLRTPDRWPALLPPRYADVARDALSDVIEAAFLDLPREERVGDRGSRCPDDVALPGVDRLEHHVRVGEAADIADRLLRDLLGNPRVRRLVVHLEKARGPRILAPIQRADVDVPVVDEMVENLDELSSLLLSADSEIPVSVRLLEGVDR